jgi:hypothetical protein
MFTVNMLFLFEKSLYFRTYPRICFALRVHVSQLCSKDGMTISLSSFNGVSLRTFLKEAKPVRLVLHIYVLPV